MSQSLSRGPLRPAPMVQSEHLTFVHKCLRSSRSRCWDRGSLVAVPVQASPSTVPNLFL